MLKYKFPKSFINFFMNDKYLPGYIVKCHVICVFYTSVYQKLSK